MSDDIRVAATHPRVPRTVFVDGIPIQQYDPHYLRRHMAVVAQETVLFDKTIKENLVYGLPEPKPSRERWVQ